MPSFDIYLYIFIASSEMQGGNPRGGVTSIADIAFATLNNGKKDLKIIYKNFILNITGFYRSKYIILIMTNDFS